MSQILRTLVRTNPRIYRESVFQTCVLPEKLKHLCNEGCMIRQTPHIPRCCHSKMDSCAAMCDEVVVPNCPCKTKRSPSSSNTTTRYC